MKPIDARRFVIAALVVSAAAGAQDVPTYSASVAAVPTGDTPICSGGVVYDDNSFETTYGIGNGDPGDAIVVQKFALGTVSSLDQACVCFSRSQNNPGAASFPFEIVVYDDNGVGGQPGTLLGAVDATANNVPVFPGLAFFSVDMTGSGINLPGGNVFVGARWAGGPNHFICGDRSATTPQRDVRGSGDHGATWPTMGSLFPAAPPRAMGIRVDPNPTTAVCVPSNTTLCLNDGRYAVTTSWQTGTGNQGAGRAVSLTGDTGYFWFFTAANVEMIVKVLDGCGVNSHYWVFAGGLTDVRVELTVTDTLTGVVRNYINPQGAAFQPIQDTSAFATCP